MRYQHFKHSWMNVLIYLFKNKVNMQNCCCFLSMVWITFLTNCIISITNPCLAEHLKLIIQRAYLIHYQCGICILNNRNVDAYDNITVYLICVFLYKIDVVRCNTHTPCKLGHCYVIHVLMREQPCHKTGLVFSCHKTPSVSDIIMNAAKPFISMYLINIHSFNST